jgi:hypothetical protein
VRIRTVRVGIVEAVRALSSLVVIEVSLRTSSLPRTCQRLGVRLDVLSSQVAAEPAVLPRWARPAVLVTCTLLKIWPSGNCLRRSLLLGHRLRELDPVLRIGVLRDAQAQFLAHCWLEVDGKSLDPTASTFHVLAAPPARLGS